VPSNFAEDLPVHAFPDPHEYPVATATQKAIEVYERLVVRRRILISHRRL
jgi:septum formation protein